MDGTPDTMSKVTLQRASELTGKSRSTIHRAMEKGRLSFEKDDTGNRVVDVSELERAFGLLPQRDDEGDGAEELRRHDVQLIELRAQLEIERSKRTMLEQRVDELREERDRWRNQAERILTDQRSREEREREAVATQSRSLLARMFRRR